MAEILSITELPESKTPRRRKPKFSATEMSILTEKVMENKESLTCKTEQFYDEQNEKRHLGENHWSRQCHWSYQPLNARGPWQVQESPVHGKGVFWFPPWIDEDKRRASAKTSLCLKQKNIEVLEDMPSIFRFGRLRGWRASRNWWEVMNNTSLSALSQIHSRDALKSAILLLWTMKSVRRCWSAIVFCIYLSVVPAEMPVITQHGWNCFRGDQCICLFSANCCCCFRCIGDRRKEVAAVIYDQQRRHRPFAFRVPHSKEGKPGLKTAEAGAWDCSAVEEGWNGNASAIGIRCSWQVLISYIFVTSLFCRQSLQALIGWGTIGVTSHRDAKLPH